MATAKTDYTTPSLRLPDPSSFARPKIAASAHDVPMGTPIGLDLEAWAYAYIDLAEKPDRVARMRARLAGRGYQVAEGGQVAGIVRAELWVLPRPLYVEQMQLRRKAQLDGVRAGRVSDCVLNEPKVDYRPPRR
jgi:hypothetical protein